MKEKPSSRKQGKSQRSSRVAERAQQLSEAAGRPKNPDVHAWLKAEAETSLAREREVAAQRTVRADPGDPV